MYSESKFFHWRPYFSNTFNEAIEKRNIENVHLVVFVHGLEGKLHNSSLNQNISIFRNIGRLERLQKLSEDCNAGGKLCVFVVGSQPKWNMVSLHFVVYPFIFRFRSSFTNMAENLHQELSRAVERMPRVPNKISMITHSLGGLIVRTMLELEKMKPLLPKLHTLITLNSPHIGLCYNQRTANWGKSGVWRLVSSNISRYPNSPILEKLQITWTVNNARRFQLPRHVPVQTEYEWDIGSFQNSHFGWLLHGRLRAFAFGFDWTV